MASSSILLAGFIVGAYCVQLRGPGMAALLANGALPELVLVGGALVALAVVVHLSIFRALTGTSGAGNVRSLLRRALEILGSPDGEMSAAYAALPAEVRELVGLFDSQRTREQQIEREKQHLREEMRELVQAFEQSSATMQPMPVGGSGEFLGRVAQVWNQMLGQAHGGAPRPSVPSVAAAPSAFPGWAATAETAEPVSGVAQRLVELEGRFSALQEQMRTLQPFGATAETAEAPALFAPEETLEAAPGSTFATDPGFTLETGYGPEPEYPTEVEPYSPRFAVAPGFHDAPLAAAAESPSEPLPLMAEPEILAPEAEIESDESGATWTDVVPTAVPWTPASLASAAYDLPLPAAPEPGFAPEPDVAPEPPPTPEEELRWSKSEVAQPSQPTIASESGYFEWTGASTRGSWKLLDAANEELTRDTDASAAPPAPAAPPQWTASAAPGAPAPARPAPAPASGQSFETYFPHFVGKPVGELEGRVAVSFEGKSTGAAASRQPATPGLEADSDTYAPNDPRQPWRPA